MGYRAYVLHVFLVHTYVSDQGERNKEVLNLFCQELSVLYTFIIVIFLLLYQELSDDLFAVLS